MRTVKFKKPGSKIVFVTKGKPPITEADLTIELYDKLVARNPNYKKLFLVTGDGESPKVSKPKPEKAD